MAERYDVVVVGARCAGAPLATFLARGGMAVAAVDRATFPSPAASTHLFQAEGIRVLDRLGVVDELLAAGAPWVEQAYLRVDDLELSCPWPTRPADRGGFLGVRREVLDTLLVAAAEAAGVDVRQGTRFLDVVRVEDRVVGARVVGPGGVEEELWAQVVVGADGRYSAVARAVGSRTYHEVPNERFGTWAYFRGVDPGGPATVEFHRLAGDFLIAAPVDAGLFLVIAVPPLERLGALTADREAGFAAELARCPALEARVAGTERIGPVNVVSDYPGYFRESAGPGWALVGDAGHFKDPTPGQGISDALRQAERLAEALLDAGARGPDATDGALRRWATWRDRDALEVHWLAHDLGKAGRPPRVFVELARKLFAEPDGPRRFFDVLNHRVRPSQVLTPVRLAGATSRMLRRGEPAGEVLSEVADLVRTDLRRRWRNRRPPEAVLGAAGAAAG